MGANQGASGNKLRTGTDEVSVAVAANRVSWKSQDLEAGRHEEAGERFATSVADLARAAFSTIDHFGSPENKASLVAKLNELLATIGEQTTVSESQAEVTDSHSEGTSIDDSESQNKPLTSQYSAIEHPHGYLALM